ncbi:MAG: sigma-70 family RNA polymerase sigma factor [Polyangiaceae bacterium]
MLSTRPSPSRPPSDPPSGVRLRPFRAPAEEQEFRAFASAQHARIRAIARQHHIPVHVAEEMLQEAIEATWNAWQRGDVRGPSGWFPWLDGALRYRARNYRRAERRALKYEADFAYYVDYLHGQARSPEDLALLAEYVRELRAALGRLSPERRDVVSLRMNGLSVEDIAEKLGLPFETVRTRWRLAVADIRSERERDRKKNRFRRAVAAFLSSASAFLLALWRRLLGRDRSRDRTGAVLACASLAFVLCCHDALRPVQRADSAFSSVFGAVASIQGLLPHHEPAEVEPSPVVVPVASATMVPPPSEPDDGSATARRSATTPAAAPSPARPQGPPEDVLLRLAFVASKSDPARAERLLREHARRFGPLHATTRRQLMDAIAALRSSPVVAPVEKP